MIIDDVPLALPSARSLLPFGLPGMLKSKRHEMELAEPNTQEYHSLPIDYVNGDYDYHYDGDDVYDDVENDDEGDVCSGCYNADNAGHSSGRKGFYYL